MPELSREEKMTTDSKIQFLQYVTNTNGGATKENFVEDWEPIGERVWDELWGAELIEFDENRRVILTKQGQARLHEI